MALPFSLDLSPRELGIARQHPPRIGCEVVLSLHDPREDLLLACRPGQAPPSAALVEHRSDMGQIQLPQAGLCADDLHVAQLPTPPSPAPQMGPRQLDPKLVAGARPQLLKCRLIEAEWPELASRSCLR